MTLEELKQKTKAQVLEGLQKFKDSSLYSQLTEAYENSSPLGQKAFVLVLIGLPLLILFYFPWSFYSASQLSLASYTEKRELLRELHRASREITTVAQFPTSVETTGVQTALEQVLTRERILPEQNKGINITSVKSQLVPEKFSNGALQVRLEQLTFKQVVDLATQMEGSLKNFGKPNSLKMTDLVIASNLKDPRYQDVEFTLHLLKAPEALAAPAASNPRAQSPQTREPNP